MEAKIDTTKISRLEVIDHSKEGGGRVYTYWNEYRDTDKPDPKVTLSLQDDGRTLKIFIE